MANASDVDVKEHKLPYAASPRLIDPALLDQAVAVLERKVGEAPQDPQSWRRLGDLHRRRGDFPAAAKAYRELQALQGDATANWLVAVASGAAPSEGPPDGIQAAPFLHVMNFLTAAQRERLLAITRRGKKSFVPARIQRNDSGLVVPEIRNALHAGRQDAKEVHRWFVPKLRPLIPRATAHLQLGPLNQRYFELEITAHIGGGLFRMHSDSGDERNKNRIISYVCYFHDEPRRFDGGELLLHDYCRESKDVNPSSFTRINPVGNSIVFFPSDCHHQVLRVDCRSASLRNGRFTVNGWVRVKTAASSRAPANGEAEAEEAPEQPATST